MFQRKRARTWLFHGNGQVYIRLTDTDFVGVVCPVMACWTSIPEWKVRPICSCVIHHMFRCRGWRTLPMPPAPPGRSVPRQSYDAQWVSSAQRGTLYPYASERACIPHIPKPALLFAGCHFLSILKINVFFIIINIYLFHLFIIIYFSIKYRYTKEY